jgi:hypothetical protein
MNIFKNLCNNVTKHQCRPIYRLFLVSVALGFSLFRGFPTFFLYFVHFSFFTAFHSFSDFYFPALHTSHFTLQLITHPKSWSLTTTHDATQSLLFICLLIYNLQQAVPLKIHSSTTDR